MTNGQKLLEAFPNSKADETGFIWSVGFTVRVLNQAHTFIIDREWWNAECIEEEQDETAYQRGWSDALDALEAYESLESEEV
jgi:hypothetical protein